jgi:ABC-type transport system substrate-binding protein/class 3 adenylate cyclase
MTDQRADVGAESERDSGLGRGESTTRFRAFLLSDIRGYSTFSAARGDEASAALTGRFIGLAEDVVGRFGGEHLGNRGDEVLHAFESPRQAIRAAVAFEQALLDATREDPSLPLPAGVGIDVGEAVVVPDGWRSNAINVAARLCSLAKGGEILATREAVHLAQAIDGIDYVPRPATQVKGIPQPVNVVRVVAESGDTIRGFAELGLTHAAEQPAHLHSRRGPLAAVVAVAVIVVAAVILLLAESGSASVPLAAGEVGAIATGSGEVAQALPVGGQPTSVAVGDDSIWAVSAGAGELYRIDPKTRSVTPIAVGNDPVAVTVAPGSVWVANSGDGTVSRVSPQTDAVVGDPIQVGAGPSALAATSNAVWVANTLDGSVSKISLSTDRVVGPFYVGSEPAGVAAGDGSVWVADEGDGTVYQLDQQTGDQVAAPITVGNGLTGVAFGDDAAWVVNNTDGTLSRIDPQSRTVTTNHVGQGPYAVAAGHGGVWVSDEYGNEVVRVDPATLSVIQTTKTNSAPLGLALAGDRLWVATDGNGASAHRGGVLYGLVSGTDGFGGGDTRSIDPDTSAASFQPQYGVLTMTSDGLVGWRRVGGVAGAVPVPDLAVSLPVPTDNGLAYTFHIRPGIRYSTGVPLRASDFRRGLQRAFRLGDYDGSYDYPVIIGAQRCLKRPARCDLSRGMVADDATNTLTIHLAAPDPDLLDQLTLPAAFPVPPGAPVSPRTRSVPGTGAYEVSSYTPAAPHHGRAHGLLVLTRNPYFRQWSAAAQPAGFPDRIVVKTNYSQAEQVTAVEQGRTDFAWDGPPFGEVTSLELNSPATLHQYVAPATTWLWLNVRSPPFNNLLAREAFNYAINRQVLAQASDDWFDRGRPTCQLLPPAYSGYVPYCPYTTDVAKAQALVHQSGTSGDKVTLITPSDGPRYEHLLATALREIGYRPRTLELPFSTYWGRPARFYARYQAGLANWLADYLTASDFLGPLIDCSGISSSYNMGGICNHTLDASIATALSNENVRPGIAAQQWAAIDRDVTEQAVVVPIDNQLGWDFVARRVGNYQRNPQLGMLMDQLWVR